MGMGRGEARAHRGQLTSFHSSRARCVEQQQQLRARCVEQQQQRDPTLLVYSKIRREGIVHGNDSV
jgi:hypothetical protein